MWADTFDLAKILHSPGTQLTQDLLKGCDYYVGIRIRVFAAMIEKAQVSKSGTGVET